jgi:hypothetical protein
MLVLETMTLRRLAELLPLSFIPFIRCFRPSTSYECPHWRRPHPLQFFWTIKFGLGLTASGIDQHGLAGLQPSLP